MLTINTNISSLITQNSLKSATATLNQSIERMTTGYKVNHSGDNAAAYSISTDMSTRIGAYEVAEDNVATGLDLLNTAEGSLDLILDKLSRLRVLQEQTMNGTYGQDSLNAINGEANAIVNEIVRLYNTTEFNGIKLFGDEITSTAESSADLINSVTPEDTTAISAMADIDATSTLARGRYKISSVEDLKKLAQMTNSGRIEAGSTFILSRDIDLSGVSNWTPIGNGTHAFSGTFDGNGYSITGLRVNTSGTAGLFGNVNNTTSIKDLAVTDASVRSSGSAGAVLVGAVSDGSGGAASNLTIQNCYVTGGVNSANAGSVVGQVNSGTVTIKDVISDADVTGTNIAGGFVAETTSGKVGLSNCWMLGDVTSNDIAGGMLGEVTINNLSACYVLGKVTAPNATAFSGTTQMSYSSSITNCAYNVDDNPGLDAGDFVDASGMIATAPINAMSKDDLLAILPNYNATHDDAGGGPIIGDNIVFQVGIDSGESSRISVDTTINLSEVLDLKKIGLIGSDYLSMIDRMMASVNDKQTYYGAAQNRLESALDEISTKYENLVSSRSTLRDADISEVSSTYIQSQILQTASSTLLATANQTPSIALQLL